MDTLIRIIGAIATAIAHFRRGASPEKRPSQPAAHPPAPRLGSGGPHDRFGGRRWRYDAAGVHADGRVWRTPGAPVTCRAILDLYGPLIRAMADKHGVNAALIVMTIATETGAFRGVAFTGPRTFRWESHVLNTDVATPFRGTYSAGPMQILATTARALVAQKGDAYALPSDAVAPTLRQRPDPAPARHPLYEPAINIELGTAYIRRHMDLTGDDPILVAATYNSGGIHRSEANAWRLRSHGDHLDRAARWYGDACAVLAERGLV